MVPAYPPEKRYEAYHAQSVVKKSPSARFSDLAMRRKSQLSPVRPFPISQLLNDISDDNVVTDMNNAQSQLHLRPLEQRLSLNLKPLLEEDKEEVQTVTF